MLDSIIIGKKRFYLTYGPKDVKAMRITGLPMQLWGEFPSKPHDPTYETDIIISMCPHVWHNDITKED